MQSVVFFREEKKNFRWFSEEEIEKFLCVCDARMKSAFFVSINTGMRISELLSLKCAKVDFVTGYITFEESKTDEYRQENGERNPGL